MIEGFCQRLLRFLGVITLVLGGIFYGGWCQLIINVKNEGGDVLQESVIANTSDDIIILEFQRPEGTLVTQLIDFKAEAQIFRVLILGEEERGETQYQVVCFVIKSNKIDFISADAVSKLRQRNPSAIRQPEEDRGKELFEMDLSVELNKSSIISSHLPELCEEATTTTFAREVDLRAWTDSKNYARDIVSLTAAVKRFPPPQLSRCHSTSSWSQPCQCQLEVCVGWYPCSLKYCRGKDSSGRTVNYRCGIKTCRKSRVFYYYVQHKHLCLWDE